MTFAQPLLLLSLLVVPLVILLYLLAQRRRARYAVKFTNMEVLASVVSKHRSWRRYVAPIVFLLALSALCVALARPQRSTLVASQQATVILVVDVSRSMEATDVKPTRLGAATDSIRKFLDHAPKGLRVALIAFAGEAQVAAPPTFDHNLVRESLAQLPAYSGYGGTAIGDALAAAVLLAKQVESSRSLASASAGSGHGPVSILFLSDGAQTRGLLLPLQGAQRAKDAHIPVYTIALGTPNGTLDRGFGQFTGRVPVPPDPVTLRAIAETTGGEFFAAQSTGALHAAYSKLGNRLTRVPRLHEVTYAFVGAAALLLVGAGLLSALWSPRLP